MSQHPGEFSRQRTPLTQAFSNEFTKHCFSLISAHHVYREFFSWPMERQVLVKFGHNIPGIVKSRTVPGNFDIQNILLWQVLLSCAAQLFCPSNFTFGYLNNQLEGQKMPTTLLLIDVLGMTVCSYFASGPTCNTQ